MANRGNSNLHDSSKNKQDEFYTNLQLIEDELKHYRAHFLGKRILCNCDDPWESNFFKFFAMNFNALGLKSLTATCYATSPVAQMELDLFGEGNESGNLAPCSPSPQSALRMNGSAIRQQILETALGWIADRDGTALEDYMAVHQHDGDCADLWSYFEAVFAWVAETFPNTRAKLMKGLPWGIYYNKFGGVQRDPAALEERIAQLLRDDEDVGDITNQRGIYEYLLDGDERHLSIRAFSPKMARTAYERQGGKCVRCGKQFAIEEMQADHITPWAKGGKTVAENCQMLCADCNRRKSDV